MAEKKGVKYFVVDAFAESAFKGNPAAVCFLDDDNDNQRDDAWLQSLAAEFNLSETCFLTPIIGDFPRFRLRWFTPVAEVDLCGHATLASAHVLFSTGLIDSETVVLSSWEAVIELQPRLDEISKCPCEGMMVSAAASAESTYDFCSRYFAPRFGINEDPVTGSAHCALAHYWSLKMNKCDFFAYQASSRGGTLKVHLDKEKQRVLLRGKAVTVMEGYVLV
ncbi:phenazine biosynthesis-like domain-containing protein 2 isoform X2 [Arabidopsis lyrata subsp. lyrata]|uniref:phenazine biosynthesis-like domain-containing protein 2 isoform X2 n=1 Tax=Arabidopsis lyrata subsp. lyrata TaxID=81972 RepID=UPI000A29A4C6|nr:phenazine biosynthesis-like domain-containing protein 2 isoform X2 [Arabidopsis lyrata subsp. lyrata]|eukprot:XP_020868081.1 phenazine biosynthesis-like domain-containing protein 2 isoform X2 [Arabidopsis lyrata subsp. lyrata]